MTIDRSTTSSRKRWTVPPAFYFFPSSKKLHEAMINAIDWSCPSKNPKRHASEDRKIRECGRPVKKKFHSSECSSASSSFRRLSREAGRKDDGMRGAVLFSCSWILCYETCAIIKRRNYRRISSARERYIYIKDQKVRSLSSPWDLLGSYIYIIYRVISREKGGLGGSRKEELVR